MGGDENERNTCDISTDMFEPNVERENMCDIDNDDYNENNAPAQMTSPLRRQKKHSTNQEHYGKLMAQVKDIVKVCEGDEDIWQYCHNAFNDILLQITRDKCKKRDVNNSQSNNAKVSICPPMENNHKTGRYKSFYEYKKS